jgi:hypothetical protein
MRAAVRVANERVKKLEVNAERNRAALREAQTLLREQAAEESVRKSAEERRWSFAEEAVEAARAVTAWVDNGIAGDTQAPPAAQFNFEEFRKGASRQIDLKRQRLLVSGPGVHGEFAPRPTPRHAPSLSAPTLGIGGK